MSVITVMTSSIPGNLIFVTLNPGPIVLVWAFIALAVSIGLFAVLIFKAESLVDLMKLDRGFDDDKIELGNFSSADVVKIGAFIIGGLLILNNISTFLSHTLFAFKGSVVGRNYGASENFNWALSGINILFGVFLITNYGFVAKLLKPSDRKEESE